MDSPIVEILEPPRSTTPCPRSFTPTSQPKKPRKKELPVKVAEISTKTGYQCKPNNLSKETFVVMKKAREGSLRAGQNRSGIRESSQKVWKYVTNLSSRGRASVTPTGKRSYRSTHTKINLDKKELTSVHNRVNLDERNSYPDLTVILD